jgi:hypothetical protein
MADWDITAKGSAIEIDTDNFGSPRHVEIDSSHWMLSWASAADPKVQVITVDTSTWQVSTAGSRFNYGGSYAGSGMAMVKIDDNHFFYTWGSAGGSIGQAGTFVVNTSTWEISTAAGHFYSVPRILRPSVNALDTNHFLVTWQGMDSDGFAEVFVTDTSTWAVTTAGAALEYDTESGSAPWTLPIIDSNHFLHTYIGGKFSAARALTLTVNTSTWAVTTSSSTIVFDGVSTPYEPRSSLIDNSHAVVFWTKGSTLYGSAQVLAVNSSTYAVTTAGAMLTFDTSIVNASFHSNVAIDSNHFLNAWNGEGNDGYIGVFAINLSTWEVTTKSILEYDTNYSYFSNIIMVDSSHFILGWTGTDGDGFLQAFEVEVPTGGPILQKGYPLPPSGRV